MQTVRVELKEAIDNSYDILIDEGAINNLTTNLKNNPIANAYAIVTDSNVAKLYGKKLLKDFHLKSEEVCFVGDDLPDLPVLRRVGFAVAVADAVPEVKKAAHYVTQKRGGKGAVREVVELILKTKRMWRSLVARFDHE